jgi:hypothetical protein
LSISATVVVAVGIVPIVRIAVFATAVSMISSATTETTQCVSGGVDVTRFECRCCRVDRSLNRGRVDTFWQAAFVYRGLKPVDHSLDNRCDAFNTVSVRVAALIATVIVVVIAIRSTMTSSVVVPSIAENAAKSSNCFLGGVDI